MSSLQTDYFKITLSTAGKIYLYQCNTSTKIEYSTNNGVTWVAATKERIIDSDEEVLVLTITLSAAGSVLFRSRFRRESTFGYHAFRASVPFSVSGNVMSLVYGISHFNKVNLTNKWLYRLFYNSTNLTDASRLILPATVLGKESQKEGGTSSYYTLTSDKGYNQMFAGCTSLLYPPKVLPAKLIDYGWYNSMFAGCSSLKITPRIEAIRIRSHSFDAMFLNCTSLLETRDICPSNPSLDGIMYTNGNTYKFDDMFNGCSNLKKIRTNIPFVYHGRRFSRGLPSTGVLYTDQYTDQNIYRGEDGIPSGWTVQPFEPYEEQ